jgi:iron complex outermembrane receptor protein
MNHAATRRRSQSLPIGLAFSVIACSINAAFAAEPTDLGTVGAQGEGRVTVVGAASRAGSVAPTQSSLNATQPQSIIDRSFFENFKSPANDYTGIAAIAPSVTGGISPNGPGLGEAKNAIRGFKDGDYNVTFDGIPFGDTNGPTHHSTAYFPAEVIGRVVVERGPGMASNFGQATFGGSVNLFSREIAQERKISPYFSYGSWNTQIYGARFDSGMLGEAGDARFALNVGDVSSDGYRTYSAVDGQNYVGKFQKALGASTLLTVNVNYNKNRYDQPDSDNGMTNAQAAKFGKNYVLSNNQNQADYYLYNRVQKSTAMNYVRLQSDLGSGWAIDNNAYYYNYTNNGKNANKSEVPGTSFAPNAIIPGYIKTNEYWVAGDILKATKQMEAGLMRFGLWAERADTHRSRLDFDMRTMTPLNDQTAVPGVYNGPTSVNYEQKSGWHNYQPFVEFEWSVSKNLTVTPGLKAMRTSLTIDAQVNQGSRIPQNVSKDFSATLPFLTANYKLSETWSTYAQYAKGMRVPDISSYQSAGANATNITPQTSTNYQLGVVHQSNQFTFDADIYYIDFNNKIAQIPASNPAVFYNQGGVVYKGVEGQVTYAISSGLFAYVNGSINRAPSKASGLTVQNVADSTAALGLLYKSAGWSGSLMYKRVGSMYALDEQGYKLNPYSTTDLNVGYTFTNPGLGAKTLKLQAAVYNLLDKQEVIAVKVTNATLGTANYGQPAAADTFLWQPVRSFMLTARAEF